MRDADEHTPCGEPGCYHALAYHTAQEGMCRFCPCGGWHPISEQEYMQSQEIIPRDRRAEGLRAAIIDVAIAWYAYRADYIKWLEHNVDKYLLAELNNKTARPGRYIRQLVREKEARRQALVGDAEQQMQAAVTAYLNEMRTPTGSEKKP